MDPEGAGLSSSILMTLDKELREVVRKMILMPQALFHAQPGVSYNNEPQQDKISHRE